MATIVQNYGPIYGEVVNGTVQGRPNGSIYVPLSNVVVLTFADSTSLTVRRSSDNGLVLNKLYHVVATSQDPTSHVRVSTYTDSACTTMFGVSGNNHAAGLFNFDDAYCGWSLTAPTTGSSYYVRAELINNGSLVAASLPVEVVGQ